MNAHLSSGKRRLNGRFGVPRLRGGDRLKAELRTCAIRAALFLLLCSGFGTVVGWGVEPTNQAARPLAEALSPEKWARVEKSIDHGLKWLSGQQATDGSFPTVPQGQPAVTSFCVMAFLSRGDQPGAGEYGRQMNRAIDFVLGCQMADGLFSYERPAPEHQTWHASHTAAYNHAIAGLMLGEVYGQVTGERAARVPDSNL